MRSLKKLAAGIALLFLACEADAQLLGVGADVMYNFQTEGLGAGVRANFYPNRRLSFVPQFSYYFPFNKVTEYYFGMGVEYKIVPVSRFIFYGLGHAAYNSWLNYEESDMEGAKKSNWNLELGGGLTNTKCLRPFLEYRYNIRFKETHLRLGLLYIFGCSKGGVLGRRTGGGGKHKICPAYKD